MKKYNKIQVFRNAMGFECENNLKNSLLMPSLLALAIAVASEPATARDYFNPAALELKDSGTSELDLEQFANNGGQMPGSYRVDIYLNSNRIDTREVTFVESDGKLKPEISVNELADMGVQVDAFPAFKQLPADQPVTQLSDYIPDADSQFDFGRQRLDISIPQAALTSEARGYVDPELWDQGMPAALLNYSFSGSNTRRDNRQGSDNSYYLNLRSGLNLGAWRLRNYSTYNDNSDKKQWDSVNTYLQRDIQSLKGQLTLGDSASPGDVFGSVQFRGAQLASDDNMYPDSLRGFAPVIRGIAQSNAQVTVRQNGYVIYQSYVPPGAFAITDLYPTASSGDLDVTITEANGMERHFVQPFSAVPVMLREGRMKYALTAGKYRSLNSTAATPKFGQGALIYGLPYDSTVYGGVLSAENYNAQVLGFGHGFGDFGSISVDATQANTKLNDGSHHTGQSYRFQYAKDIDITNTTFTLAGYRYSTSGFYDFQEANELGFFGGDDWRRNYNKRSKAQANINQSLKEYGNFYISAYQQDYWGSKGYERNLSTGYNLSHAGITYGLNYTYSQAPGNNANDQQVAFNVQISLSKWLNNSWASYNMSTSKRGNTSNQVGISGTALADNNLSYSVQQSYANKGGGATGTAIANYKGTYSEVSAGYNYTESSEQINYGLQGGVVAHPYGVTLSQTQGETLALVRAPGVKEAKVQNNTGVRTDWRGYAVVPYVSTYRQNRIAIDTETLADNVDIDTNTQTVIPTQGALVLADFKTRVGSRTLINLTYQGKPVPFGATASLIQKAGSMENSGIVGPDGQLYMSGMPEKGQLKVKWGNGNNNSCQVAYTLPGSVNASISTMNAVCK